MSGHSKWATIKHKKAAADAKRGAAFTRVIRELMQAARKGGSASDTNAALRTAIAHAKAAGMPKDTMERAIKKGAGELEGQQMEDLLLEGYGPGGCALLIDITTDSRNRIVAEIRHIFTKYGKDMAAAGSVTWMFAKKGQILVEGADFDKLFEFAVEAGADDVQDVGGAIEVTTSPDVFHAVREKIEQAGFNIANAELAWVPSTTVKLEGKEAEGMLRLIGKIEELDDVNGVYGNHEIDEATIVKFNAAGA
jgi:YebC/PmpR family DNA-binding regulatory protein